MAVSDKAMSMLSALKSMLGISAPPSAHDVSEAGSLFSARTAHEINVIRSALERYAVDRPDTLYGNDPERLVRYYNEGRIISYLTIMNIMGKHGVDLCNKKVADIGSFLPVFLKMLDEDCQPAEIHAYELNPNIIEITPYYCDKIAIHGSNFFQETVGRYEAIFCTQVLEHLVDPAHAFQAVLDGLVSGGVAFFAVPDGRRDTRAAGDMSSDGKSYSGHINFWSPESWVHFVAVHIDSRHFHYELNKYEYNNNYVVIWKNAHHNDECAPQ